MCDFFIKLYFLFFLVGEFIINDIVFKVICFDIFDFVEGDLIVVYFFLVEYVYLSVDQFKDGMIRCRVDIKNFKIGKDLGLFLGLLGMLGLMVWSLYYEIGQLKKGEMIFISFVVGVVGQVVGQVVKWEGFRVIGLVGLDEKFDFIFNEFGFDGGFNYKIENLFDVFKWFVLDGVDIYFENVGGEQFEVVIEVMNQYGRIIVCGMISQYSVFDE